MEDPLHYFHDIFLLAVVNGPEGSALSGSQFALEIVGILYTTPCSLGPHIEFASAIHGAVAGESMEAVSETPLNHIPNRGVARKDLCVIVA